MADCCGVSVKGAEALDKLWQPSLRRFFDSVIVTDRKETMEAFYMLKGRLPERGKERFKSTPRHLTDILTTTAEDAFLCNESHLVTHVTSNRRMREEQCADFIAKQVGPWLYRSGAGMHRRHLEEFREECPFANVGRF